ncbi:Gfo/Idh/MocA family oxidoreductase [Frankia sp. AiPs1]
MHLQGYQAVLGVELVALTSRTRARAEAVAARYGVARVTDSVEELIDAVDVVSIATPPDSHRELVLAAVAAGRHVLCDKPLAVNGTEARAMVDAAHATGVRHASGFIWRGDPALLRLRELLGMGAIGRCLEIHTACMLPVPALPMNWMYDRDLGGGALTQHGCHAIDWACWLLDSQIHEVNGRLTHDIRETAAGPRFHDISEAFAWSPGANGEAPRNLPVSAETGYDFTAIFANGVHGRFWEAWHRAGPYEDHVIVYGDTGTLEWRGALGLQLHRIGREPVTLPLDGGLASGRLEGMRRWRELTGRFIAAVQGDCDPDLPTLDDGWHACAVVDAVHRSQVSRSWETVAADPGLSVAPRL